VIISVCLLGTGNAKPMQTKDSPSEDVFAPEEVHLNEKTFDPYDPPTFYGW